METLTATLLVDLVNRAKDISDMAYCPYSKFHVGAALITTDGRIFTGCNVENASYGLTICAERNAIFHMIVEGGGEILAIVIYTPTMIPSAPCGACRQVINEFGPNARIVSVCDNDAILDGPLSEFLPYAFGPKNLL